MNHTGRCSVVISTYNRAASLERTLRSLRALDYDRFEVVVVLGPSSDDTEAVVARHAPDAKLGYCPRRNLSESRNIGIGLAAGDVVAFIDDDAYADPWWLDDLMPVFEDPEVAATGGPVFDHTGVSFQAKYNVADVFGNARVESVNPSRLLNTVFGQFFPYPTGTNSLFRRADLLAIGGFDEEYEYYLDETDVCKRLVDRGRTVRLVDRGFVYHMFLPSGIRGPAKVPWDFSVIIKNTTYFACKHGIPHSGRRRAYEAVLASIQRWDGDVRHHVASGIHPPGVYEKFFRDRDACFAWGLDRWAAGEDRTRPRDWFAALQSPFAPYATNTPAAGRRHLGFVAERPTAAVLDSVCALARDGDVVRVLSGGAEHDQLDLENGVWMHRLTGTGSGFDQAASRELDRIVGMRPLDAVQRL